VKPPKMAENLWNTHEISATYTTGIKSILVDLWSILSVKPNLHWDDLLKLVNFV
jgi:hypothetical protein